MAVASADESRIAYNTWRFVGPVRSDSSWQQEMRASVSGDTGDPAGYPAVYVRDVKTGAEESLGDGTMSPAFRGDGALAFAMAPDPPYRLQTDHLRHVIVRDRADTATWSTELGEYHPLGWAGPILLAYRGDTESEAWDVVAFDGPGRQRVLAPDASVVAVNESGTRIAITEDTPGGGPTRRLRVLDPADGSTVAALRGASVVDPTTGDRVELVDGGGDWRGDTIVTAADSGLLLLRFSSGRLAVRSFVHVDSRRRPTGPRFADRTHRLVEAWVGIHHSRSAHLRCDVRRRTCARTAPVGAETLGHPVGGTPR